MGWKWDGMDLVGVLRWGMILFVLLNKMDRDVRLLGDNVETLAFKTHSLLCAIIDLYAEAKVRFISGRPHKKGLESSFQMVFKLE